MAKTQTSTTKSALLFSSGAGIYEEDLLAVVEMMNHAFGHNPKVHFSMNTGTVSAGARTHDIEFPGAGTGFQTYFQGTTWIDADVDNIEMDFLVTLAGADTPQIRVTIGGTNTTLNFAGPGPIRTSATLATSATGTGEQTIRIELNAPTGSAIQMNDGRIEDQAVTDPLPDPPNA